MSQLKIAWSELVSHQASKRLAVAVLVLYSVLLISFWILESRLPPQIPLFYSLPKGAEQLGTPGHAKQILIGTGVLVLIDLILALAMVRTWRNLTLIVLWSTLMAVGLLATTLVRIYLLVT